MTAPVHTIDVKLWIHEWCQRHGYPGGEAAIGVDGAKELLRCASLAAAGPSSPVSSAPAETPLDPELVLNVWQSTLADIVAKWKKEADCYVGGAMFESPVGDMNRASATAIRAMLADLKTLDLAGGVAKGDPAPLELIEVFIKAAETYRIHSELTWEGDVGRIEVAMMKARDDLRRALAAANERAPEAKVPVSALRALVETWRLTAKGVYRKGDDADARRLRACADELDKLAPPPTEGKP